MIFILNSGLQIRQVWRCLLHTPPFGERKGEVGVVGSKFPLGGPESAKKPRSLHREVYIEGPE